MSVLTAQARTLGHREQLAVAVAAGCAMRSIAAYLRGDRMRSTTLLRVENALRSLGYEHLLRPR